MEATNALTALRAKLQTLLADSNGLREYVMDHYLVLHAHTGGKTLPLLIGDSQ